MCKCLYACVCVSLFACGLFLNAAMNSAKQNAAAAGSAVSGAAVAVAAAASLGFCGASVDKVCSEPTEGSG